MAIEAASTAQINSTVNSTTSNVAPKKNSSESFKEELSKVSDKNTKDVDNSAYDNKDIEDNSKDNKSVIDKSKSTPQDNKDIQKVDNSEVNDSLALNDLKKNAMESINLNNTNDIWQMLSSNIQSQGFWSIGFGDDSSSLSALSMNENDAQFFINLTKNENVNVASVSTQAQNLIESGNDANQVQKSALVSQALLEALSSAREKNQPIRIDFDRNVSVILRVSQNGSINAHFIPGDKAVEQYLRNNIDSLKNTFDENDIPYSDLSYSHSSKEQNQRRRNERQGE